MVYSKHLEENSKFQRYKSNSQYNEILHAMLKTFSAVKADKSDVMQYNHRTIRILDRRHIVAQLFPLSFLTTTS